jgi:hypothetical protein
MQQVPTVFDSNMYIGTIVDKKLNHVGHLIVPSFWWEIGNLGSGAQKYHAASFVRRDS